MRVIIYRVDTHRFQSDTHIAVFLLDVSTSNTLIGEWAHVDCTASLFESLSAP